MRILGLHVIAGLAVTLMGCGQKGPLVLPDAQHPHKKIGISKPAAAKVTTPGAAAPAAPQPSNPVQPEPATPAAAPRP